MGADVMLDRNLATEVRGKRDKPAKSGIATYLHRYRKCLVNNSLWRFSKNVHLWFIFASEVFFDCKLNVYT